MTQTQALGVTYMQFQWGSLWTTVCSATCFINKTSFSNCRL